MEYFPLLQHWLDLAKTAIKQVKGQYKSVYLDKYVYFSSESRKMRRVRKKKKHVKNRMYVHSARQLCATLRIVLYFRHGYFFSARKLPLCVYTLATLAPVFTRRGAHTSVFRCARGARSQCRSFTLFSPSRSRYTQLTADTRRSRCKTYK